MQKRLLNYTDNLLNRIFNESIPIDTLEKYLINKIKVVSNHIVDNPDKRIITDIHNISAITNENFSVPLKKNPAKPSLEETFDLEYFNDWISNLPKNRIVGNKGLFPHAGTMLLRIMKANDSSIYSNFLEYNFERLLLHIEVKRKNALFPREKTSKQDHWVEKHNISIALSRYSRQKNDLRYLNTSLKLNDWAYKHHKNILVSFQLSRYLLAISEGEHTLRKYLES